MPAHAGWGWLWRASSSHQLADAASSYTQTPQQPNTVLRPKPPSPPPMTIPSSHARHVYAIEPIQMWWEKWLEARGGLTYSNPSLCTGEHGRSNTGGEIKFFQFFLNDVRITLYTKIKSVVSMCTSGETIITSQYCMQTSQRNMFKLEINQRFVWENTIRRCSLRNTLWYHSTTKCLHLIIV